MPKAKSITVATPSRHSGDGALIFQELVKAINEKQLHKYYPLGTQAGIDSVSDITDNLVEMDAMKKFSAYFPINREYVRKLCRLALYDVILLLDDSGSMHCAGARGVGTRIDDLQTILKELGKVLPLFCLQGISKTWLNSMSTKHKIRSPYDITQIDADFRHCTPLGAALESKVVEPYITAPLSKGSMKRPVYVICVTDGAPDSESEVKSAVKNAVKRLETAGYGMGGFALQVGQCGTDPKASKFLEHLDSWKRVFGPNYGKTIDVTSTYETEQAEVAKAGCTDLSFGVWITSSRGYLPRV